MDGWNAVRTGVYDLVITDVDMPRMDGIELATLIKRDAQLKSLPVMIVSYKDREEDRRRGLDAGADFYLTKGGFHEEALLQAVIDLISRVRNIRSEMNIKPSDRIQLVIAAKSDLKTVFSDSTDQIARLTRAKDVSINGTAQLPKAAARAVLAGGAEVAVPLEGLIDFAQERARLAREKDKLEKESSKLETQLGNADFVQRAPAEKVEELRARVADIAERNAALEQMLEALS